MSRANARRPLRGSNHPFPKEPGNFRVKMAVLYVACMLFVWPYAVPAPAETRARDGDPNRNAQMNHAGGSGDDNLAVGAARAFDSTETDASITERPAGARGPATGGVVYSNDFDDPSALAAFTIVGDGQVSLESGQVRFDVDSPTTATLDARIDFSPGYNPVLSANSGLISWSCNVSNSDAVFNNGFIVILASTETDPFSTIAHLYSLRGGSSAFNRMMLYRSDYGLGGGGEVLIDVPDGIGTLPDKGSIKITYDPTTDEWTMLGVAGPEYLDPITVSNVLGTAIDATYTTVETPYVGVGGRGTGVDFFDNLSVTVAGPEECLNQPEGTPCGSSSGTECDSPDTCDGAGLCRENHQPAGTPCGGAPGSECDAQNTCDGAGICLDNLQPAGTPCGSAVSSDCDAPDSCDGAGACLENHEPFGTACPDDGIECTIDICDAGSCTHPDEVNCTPCSTGVCIASECVPIASVMYVDRDATTGADDGSSWANAFVDLQNALARARACPGLVDEIWVAAGTYTPAPPGGDRYLSFELISGVGLYGGFADWETSRDERDLRFYPTILSGDLNGDDGPDFQNYDENSLHVVIGSGTDQSAILDGFMVTAGNANAYSDHASDGAGMLNLAGNPTVINCIFSANRSSQGGGMYNENSSPTVVNCLFRGNKVYASGGGMRNLVDGRPTVINCTFAQNTSNGVGGAVSSSTPATMVNSILWNNGPDPVVPGSQAPIDMTYTNVQGGYPGAGNLDRDPLFVDEAGGDFRLTPCSPCNDAGDSAAVPADTPEDLDGNPRFHNGVVDMGAFEFQGTAYTPAVPVVTHVAASFFEHCDRVVVTWDNSPDAEGYSVFRDGVQIGDATSSPYVDLTADVGWSHRYLVIAWNNCASSVSQTAYGASGFVVGGATGYPYGGLSGFVSLASCLAESPSHTGSQAGGCWDACLFSFDYDDDGDVDLYDFYVYQSGCGSIQCDDGRSCNGTETCGTDGACFSSLASDCNQNGIEDRCDIDNGLAEDCDDNGVPDACETGDNDCDGNQTPDNCDIADGILLDTDGSGVPDQCENVIYVRASAAPGGDGTSWETAFSDLQTALFTAAAPAQIWVARGTYRPAEPDGDRWLSFELLDGVALYGGFQGTESSLHERNWSGNVTRLSGDLNSNGSGASTRDDNSIRVVRADNVGASAVLDGFTITGGYANNSIYSTSPGGGGGIYMSNASPTVRNCTIVGNATGGWEWYSAPPNGAGVYCGGGSPTFVGCVLRDNHGADGGDPWKTSNSGSIGGGAYFASASPYFSRCLITGNSTGNGNGGACPLECAGVEGGRGGPGGGLYFRNSSATIVDSVIAFNRTGDGGNGVTCEGNYGECVYYARGGDAGSGGGIYALGSTVVLRGCTIYGNETGTGGMSPTASGYYEGGPGDGGAIWSDGTDTVLIDSVVWHNQPARLSEIGVDRPVITYSNVQLPYPGEGNISAEPSFVDPDGADDVGGTSDDDFRLLDESPCVNSGDPLFVPELDASDLDGNPRLQGCRVDMGAFESSVSCGECLVDAHCYDWVDCTDDICVAGTCQFIADHANCPDDGIYCNGTEVCHPVDGCISTGSPCASGEVCDEANDSCGP